MYVDRLPTAPSFTDEESYFEYLGAAVPSLSSLSTVAAPQTVTLAGDKVFVLKAVEHFQEISTDVLERLIQGKTYTLCRVARNHRVILSTDMMWTYLVTRKEVTGPDAVRLTLRRARPITNSEPIEALLFGGENA
jgi:hypothetical protein